MTISEGPSKCSYVASSSKQPWRVFPAVDSSVRRLANDSICSKRIHPIIDHFSSSNELISIPGEEFNNGATILDAYLSDPDHLQRICSTLRYTASYPSTFVHILLLPLLPELTPDSTPISNPRFKRTRNIFSTTMLTASLTVSFKYTRSPSHANPLDVSKSISLSRGLDSSRITV